MKEKRECKIVQDLLPNYVDGLTNEETNKYIEEHIKECTECTEILAKYAKKINVKIGEKDKKIVKILKKYNNKMFVFKDYVCNIFNYHNLVWSKCSKKIHNFKTNCK